ncbi:hypothetical protein Vi05172_g1961 [Venturia inaequalis]|nr:hypothetical protein Vi05172_g1961 [Venturia inaequalis]
MKRKRSTSIDVVALHATPNAQCAIETSESQPKKKPRKEPVTFLSLPHEIRQQIILQAREDGVQCGKVMGQLLEETIATIVNLQQVHGQVYEDVVYAAKLWMKDICRKLTAHTHTLIFKWFDEQSYLFLDDHPKWQDMTYRNQDLNSHGILTATMKRKRPASPENDKAAKQQPNKKPRKRPTTFLSLPREIRQQILFNIDPMEGHNYRTHQWQNSTKIKDEINRLKDVHADIHEDVVYVAKQWMTELLNEAKKELDRRMAEWNHYWVQAKWKPKFADCINRLESCERGLKTWDEGTLELVVKELSVVRDLMMRFMFAMEGI